jgi:prevent-host-death family protein
MTNVSSERPPIMEVTVRELSRDTSAVLGRAREHERLIITRHGHPIAVLLSVVACIDLVVTEGIAWPVRREDRARLKRELLARLVGPEIADQASARRLARIERMLEALPPGARGFHGH